MIPHACHQIMNTGNSALTSQYKIDHAIVYKKLRAIAYNHDCWFYLQPAKKRCDGRKAYLGLYEHYLGPNNVDDLANAAERKLTTTYYYGEKKCWNFEHHVKVHVNQHVILETLHQQVAHVGMDS